jgi:hypothetical protein
VDREAYEITKGITTLTDFLFPGPSSLSYIVMTRSIWMAKNEHPERYSWWFNELGSLGISTLDKDGLNNSKEASDLTEANKKTLLRRLPSTYIEK